MKHALGFLLAALVLAVPAASQAATASTSVTEGATPFSTPGRWGLGLASGSFNNGITAKTYFTPNFGADATVGYWWGYGLSVVADAVWEMKPIVQNDAISLNWNVGAGPLVAFGGFGSFVGANAFAGLGLQIKPVPIEITADVRPTVYFGSVSDFFVGGQGAVRYWF